MGEMDIRKKLSTNEGALENLISKRRQLVVEIEELNNAKRATDTEQNDFLSLISSKRNKIQTINLTIGNVSIRKLLESLDYNLTIGNIDNHMTKMYRVYDEIGEELDYIINEKQRKLDEYESNIAYTKNFIGQLNTELSGYSK